MLTLFAALLWLCNCITPLQPVNPIECAFPSSGDGYRVVCYEHYNVLIQVDRSYHIPNVTRSAP